LVSGFEVTANRHFLDHGSEPGGQQPENGLALAFGPAQSLGVVIKDGAGGATFETKARKPLSAAAKRIWRRAKSRFSSSSREIVDGGVQKPLEFIG
jgi:hypothetical protein